MILQPHFASLELTFYTGKQFPSDYSGDGFAAEHGSWNRAHRSGYEVIRSRCTMATQPASTRTFSPAS